MINKKDKSDPIDNLEYEKVLEEEIINSYESKFQKDTEEDSKKIKFYKLKRTPLEILNRSFFFFDIGSFLLSDKNNWITGQIFHIDGGRSSLRIKS